MKMAKLEESQLDEHLKDLVYWEGFALQLPKIRRTHIDTIKREVRDDITGQKQTLYSKWLRMCPNASWEHVVEALEKVDERQIAAKLPKTSLSICYEQTPRSQALVPPEQWEVEEVQVDEEVVDKLEELHSSFVCLTMDVKKGVESGIENDDLTMKSLVGHTEEQKAFSVPLKSVKTTDDFFQAIMPHYNFLNCYLIVSLAMLLSGSIATRASEYRDNTKQFMKETKVKHLRKQLKQYFPNSKFDDKVKVSIALENSWGTQSVWLVEQLVQQLFSLEHTDQCQWFRIISGSLLVVFLTAKHLATSLIKTSREKLQFMRLIGIFRLKIGNTYVLKDKENKFFTFEFSLIRATFDSNIEAVRFLLQYVQVNVNVRSEQISVTDQLQYIKCMSYLDAHRSCFILFKENVELLLKRKLCDGEVTLQTLLTAIETELPLNTESIKTADDFIQAIRPHYSFLSRQLLLTVASVLSESLERTVACDKTHLIFFKKRIPIEYLLSISPGLYFPIFQPDVSIKVGIKLEDIWQTHSMSLVEKLIQTIFSLKHSDECQWFRVIPGSVIVVFLVAKHKMMRLIVNSVKKREFMRLAGVISLQVGNITYSIKEAITYSIKKAIPQVRMLFDIEATDFLVQFEQGQVNRLAFVDDENRNYTMLFDPDSTALMIACCNSDVQLVELLLNNNADPNVQNRRKYTALMYASGNSKIVRMLLKHNADVSLSNIYDETVLYFACAFGNLQLVKHLLRMGISVNIKQKDGMTPLYIASMQGHVRVIEQLLQNQADHSIQDISGLTPLHAAIEANHSEVVKKLIQAQSDLNTRASNVLPPLCSAIREGHIQILEQLLQAGADPNIKCLVLNDFITPLQIACDQGKLQIVERLLQAGADPNCQASDSGSTPLHGASYEGHLEIVEVLLRARANPYIPDNCQHTPLDVATHFGHFQIAERLQKAQNFLRQAADILRYIKSFTVFLFSINNQ